MKRAILSLFGLLAANAAGAAPLTAPHASSPTKAVQQGQLQLIPRLNLRTATPNSTVVGRYQLFQLTLDLQTDATNPFDPRQIDVEGNFMAPNGETIHVPGFLYQPFHSNPNGTPGEPAGPPVWLIRFAPTQVGIWRYTVKASEPVGDITLSSARFRCVPSASPGFITRDKNNSLFFAYNNGKVFTPIGEDMCWSPNYTPAGFETWMRDLHDVGGNWIRLWMATDNNIEWSGKPPVAGHYVHHHGIGYYSLAKAWQIGRILDLAQKSGLNVMLTMGTYGEFVTGGYWGEGAWPKNPYNQANGGPCATPDDFWSNPIARRMYENRLRYMAARYGWRTNLFGWEFFNEAHPTTAWMKTMSDYLKGLGSFAGKPADPQDHLVSTTYGDDAIWKLPGVDFTMSHNYGEGNLPDFAPVVHDDAVANLQFNKPHLMAEFGIDWRKPDTPYDPEGKGVNLHNAMWSAIASGDAGTAMIWWWDSYVAPLHLYHVWKPISAFVKSIPWNEGKWQPANIDAPVSLAHNVTYQTLHLVPTFGWGKAPSPQVTVHADGRVTGTLPQYLFSPGKPDLHQPLILHLDCPHACTVQFGVNQVSNNVTLQAQVDGAPAATAVYVAAPPASGKPPYKSTTFEKQYNIYLATFDSTFDVHVPAGKHTVTVNVPSGDWLTFSSIDITDYRSSRYPDLQVYGMTNESQAFMWVHNTAHNWMAVYKHQPIVPCPASEIAVTGLKPGSYAVEYFNTTTGASTKGETVETKNGAATVKIPGLTTDLAVRLVPTTDNR